MDLNQDEPVISKPRAKRLYLILIIAIVVILCAYGAFALATSGKESTDDAQVAADIVPVAARVSGQIVAVHVTENQPVQRGALLAALGPREAAVKVAQAGGARTRMRRKPPPTGRARRSSEQKATSHARRSTRRAQRTMRRRRISRRPRRGCSRRSTRSSSRRRTSVRRRDD